MKKKEFISMTCSVMLVLVICSSIQAGSIQYQKPIESSVQTKTLTYHFSLPVIQDNNQFLTVLLDEATGYRNIPGQPILPLIMHTVELPFKATISSITCTITSLTDIQLTNKISPAIQALTPSEHDETLQPLENENIYATDQPFPNEWYSYRLTGGLNSDDVLTTFLTIQINPLRYNPVQDTLSALDSISIKLTYEHPSEPFVTLSDAYNMIIICRDTYTSLLQPLVNHKNTHGIQTKLIPLNDIYSETYFPLQGRDQQENIKYFIKNAKETWNITYVMLVGNYAQVPIRYSHLITDADGAYEESKFVSDLYYADLYDANGNFSSWDTDNDGLYAEWPYPEWQTPEDKIDMVPDVHVGRLACMFKTEVKTVVDKIISYETTAAGTDWFTRMVVIGGDTFDKSWEQGTDYNEGEVANQQALDYMPEFDAVKLWTSLGTLTTENIHEEISKGCGFVYFCGHGSPKSWATHNNGDYINWTGQFKNTDMLKLTNNGMSPVLMVGGCHNSEIDSAPRNFIIGLLTEGLNYFKANETWLGSYWKYNYALECWSWVFVKVRGGAIATIGSSGYGGVSIGDANHDSIPDCIQRSDGWFEVEFFRLYNQENITVLGQTYDQAITGYIQNFPVDTDRYDAKIVQTHVLLGDPSLQIGGYQ